MVDGWKGMKIFSTFAGKQEKITNVLTLGEMGWRVGRSLKTSSHKLFISLVHYGAFIVHLLSLQMSVALK